MESVPRPVNVYEPVTMTVNGTSYYFSNGVLEAFRSKVREIDRLLEENRILCDKNDSLKAWLNKVQKRSR